MTKSDIELLKLAAKAAGIEHRIKDVCPMFHGGPTFESFRRSHHPARPADWVTWNPFDDDGDALRLAVKLGITFRRFHYIVCAVGKTQCDEYVDDDQFSAARRAIVRAAADIGKAMP